MADYESDSVRSDIDEDEDPLPVLFNKQSHEQKDTNVQQLVAELDRERKSRQDLENSNNRLKLIAREEALKEKDLLKSRIEPLLNEQFSYISKIQQQVYSVIKIVDGNEPDLDLSDSLLVATKEMDLEECLRDSLAGLEYICELTKIAVKKVRDELVKRTCVTKCLKDKERDEVCTLDSESRLEIAELQHCVDGPRAESSLLNAQVESQAKELSQRNFHIEKLEEKERSANENVEGLMMDIIAAEEEITRWKLAAKQEAAANRAVELDFISQLSALRQELDEAKQGMLESEKKLQQKEYVANAAMAVRDAAEKSLRLADLRNSSLRDRLEDLSRQLESVNQNQNRYSYVCWPWQWLGLNSVGYSQDMTQRESSDETELSQPLI